jgi:hypothetical protein
MITRVSLDRRTATDARRDVTVHGTLADLDDRRAVVPAGRWVERTCSLAQRPPTLCAQG